MQGGATGGAREADFPAPRPVIDRRPDGTIYVTDQRPMPAVEPRLTDALVRFARERPDRVFLADRKAGGDWRRVTFVEMLARVERIAAHLLGRGLSADRPLVILSGNDIDHAALALAALHVGIPYAAISPAYALAGPGYQRFRETMAALEPGLAYAADLGAFGPALRAVIPDVPVLSDQDGEGAMALDALPPLATAAEVAAAHARVGPETIAKFLFTSGSTGSPKAVINTHGMIASNQAMTREAYAFMKTEPPVLLDWTPWHHTAGGNKIFFMALSNGGTLWIDDGRPTPGMIGRSVENLRGISPNWYFNVPTGYDALIPHLEADAALRDGFFREMRMLWYAGATLAQHSWDALQDLSRQATGHPVIIGTGLGATETAPGAMFCTWPQRSAGNVGLPLPGLTLKLVPMEGRYDARVRGPSITPGYWRRPELTAAAFDEEGFYCFGDALVPVDPDDLTRGFRFDGRTAENFKLDTGTWVATGALRTELLDHLGGQVRDVAITGADRPWLGALVFLRDPARVGDAALRAALEQRLEALAAAASGSSTRICRLLLLDGLPSPETGELTDKGSINQRVALRNRAAEVEELYRGSHRTLSVARLLGAAGQT